MVVFKKYMLFILLAVILFLSSCGNDEHKIHFQTLGVQDLDTVQNKLTDVIAEDIFAPPVASRIYAYSALAAYEAVRYKDPKASSITSLLKGFEKMPAPSARRHYDFELASVHAFCEVARQLVFSSDKMQEFESNVEDTFTETSDSIKQASISFGSQIAKAILRRAANDQYKQTRGYPRLTVRKNPGYWKPTQPEYMDAVEPYFAKLRPFMLDSAAQFRVAGPYPYSMRKSSPYYGEVMQVYKQVKYASPEQKAVAEFWDDNPYVGHHKGHLMYATKKISPGGHWLGIAQLSCRLHRCDVVQTARVYAWESVTLFDAFICCWEEKYRSITVRPETVINDLIDPNWRPILQTPPFPDYISGHSVVSAASACVLTKLLGNKRYIDSVEHKFGIAPRPFESFTDAANEAMISRFYGGIHYMKACKDGFGQGIKVGDLAVNFIERQKKIN